MKHPFRPLILLLVLLAACAGPKAPSGEATLPAAGASSSSGAAASSSGAAASSSGAAASSSGATASSSGADALTITSPAFSNGTAIPQKYSCQGDDLSPALAFSAPPEKTQSLALLVDDPDAPVGIWTHWIVYNLPPTTRSLPESASRAKGQAAQLPSGAVQGKSSFNRGDYGGPCPPSGTHHYYFRLYALDTTLPADPPLNRAGLLKAIDGHILAQGELMGTDQK